MDISSQEIDTGRNSNIINSKNIGMNFNNTLGNLSALLNNSSIGIAGATSNEDSVNAASFNNT